MSVAQVVHELHAQGYCNGC